MTTYFISRHPGAIQWANSQAFGPIQIVQHLDASLVQPGDTVLGTLPVHLAAQVCERGARYFNLCLDLPPSLRGRELSDDELRRRNARLEAYEIRRVSEPWPPA